MVNKINTILFLEINGNIYSSTDHTIWGFYPTEFQLWIAFKMCLLYNLVIQNTNLEPSLYLVILDINYNKYHTGNTFQYKYTPYFTNLLSLF